MTIHDISTYFKIRVKYWIPLKYIRLKYDKQNKIVRLDIDGEYYDKYIQIHLLDFL